MKLQTRLHTVVLASFPTGLACIGLLLLLSHIIVRIRAFFKIYNFYQNCSHVVYKTNCLYYAFMHLEKIFFRLNLNLLDMCPYNYCENNKILIGLSKGIHYSHYSLWVYLTWQIELYYDTIYIIKCWLVFSFYFINNSYYEVRKNISTTHSCYYNIKQKISFWDQ